MTTPSAKLRRVPHFTSVAAALTPLGCDALSKNYGLATGDVVIATKSDNCTLPPFPVCVPAAYDVMIVPTNTEWYVIQRLAQLCCELMADSESLAQDLSTSLANLTTTQLLYWNPNIMGLCDDLTAGQYVCAR